MILRHIIALLACWVGLCTYMTWLKHAIEHKLYWSLIPICIGNRMDLHVGQVPLLDFNLWSKVISRFRGHLTISIWVHGQYVYNMWPIFKHMQPLNHAEMHGSSRPWSGNGVVGAFKIDSIMWARKELGYILEIINLDACLPSTVLALRLCS